MRKYEYRAIMTALKLIIDDADEKKALEKVRIFVNDALEQTAPPKSEKTSKTRAAKKDK